jgi:hypothetical protein
MLEGRPVQGDFSARWLRAFIPRAGTQLVKKQDIYKAEKRIEDKTESREEEESTSERNEDEDEMEDEDRMEDEDGMGEVEGQEGRGGG